MSVTRPAALAASLSLLAACSSKPPDDPGPGHACEENCNPDTEFCNASGLCETRPEIRTRDAIARVRLGDINVMLDGAYVTYVVPETPNPDLHGFFVQATREGPGLFVAVDPLTLQPVPKPGDFVSLRVDGMSIDGANIEARLIAEWTVHSRGNDLEPLTQEITFYQDLLAERASYDSELVSIEASFQGDWLPLGRGHYFATLSAKGGFANGLQIRVPEDVAAVFGNSSLCEISLRQVPFRNSGPTVHLWAFKDEDFISRKCPETRLRQILALNPTEVRLAFERPVDPATVNSDGSQFVFTNGLVAFNAAVQPDGRYVHLITGTQVSRQEYTIGIADTVKDVLGGGLVIPPSPNGCTDVCNPNALCLGTFHGYYPRAKVVLNEMNCNLAGERDLIELRAVTSGSTAGIQLTYEGPGISGPIGTFPDANVQAGDIIVVHLQANPTNGDAICNEMTSTDQIAATSNYPLAWDFVYEDLNCAFSNVVFRVKNAEGATIDGLAVVRSTLRVQDRPPDYGTMLTKLQQDLQWDPPNCNGLSCSYFSIPTAIEVSADWAGTAMGGVSLSRKGDVDTNSKGDWGAAASSFGRPNPIAQ